MAGTARIIGVKQLEQALLNAFEEWTRDDVNGRYWKEKFQEKYRYPGPPTIRKNGETVGNPRDIIDTEALYDSGVKSYEYREGGAGAEANWHWDAKNASGDEYAWYVHEGQGPYSRAARPWTDEMASEYLFETSEIKRDLMMAIDRHLNG
jgi:hypothetical protein